MSNDYYFGTPRRVNFDGVLMDIDRVASNVESKTNCFDDWKDYNQSNGAMLSAFEHLVPEQLFSTPTEKAEGVSAVKALAIANLQGQKTYAITNTNLEAALSQIRLDANTENDIRTAVEAGKQVTTHQTNISYHGWNGAGYIIIDPETGAGAYKISGGADGGFLIGLTLVLLIFIMVFAIFTGNIFILALTAMNFFRFVDRLWTGSYEEINREMAAIWIEEVAAFLFPWSAIGRVGDVLRNFLAAWATLVLGWF